MPKMKRSITRKANRPVVKKSTKTTKSLTTNEAKIVCSSISPPFTKDNDVKDNIDIKGNRSSSIQRRKSKIEHKLKPKENLSAATTDNKEKILTNPVYQETATAATKLLPNNNNDPLEKDFRGGQEVWQGMLYNLLLYKADHGDLNVKQSATSLSQKQLYQWMQNQRKHYKKFKEGRSSFLTSDRIRVMEAIGFQWNIRGDTLWNKNFDMLLKYKEEHGHTQVPRCWKENKQLGEWVNDQRRQRKFKLKNKPSLLTSERENKLDDVGFVWQVRPKIEWMDKYNELVQFHAKHGHSHVPQLYDENRSLGKWVAKQREQYRYLLEGRHSFINPERITLLNDLEFVWCAKGRGSKEEIVDLEKKYFAGKIKKIVGFVPSASGTASDVTSKKNIANANMVGTIDMESLPVLAMNRRDYDIEVDRDEAEADVGY